MILQRIADWRREARIARLVLSITRQTGKHYHPSQRVVWEALKAEIMARSPQQVARMERRQGITHA